MASTLLLSPTSIACSLTSALKLIFYFFKRRSHSVAQVGLECKVSYLCPVFQVSIRTTDVCLCGWLNFFFDHNIVYQLSPVCTRVYLWQSAHVRGSEDSFLEPLFFLHNEDPGAWTKIIVRLCRNTFTRRAILLAMNRESWTGRYIHRGQRTACRNWFSPSICLSKRLNSGS